MQMHQAKAYCVSVSDKYYAFTIEIAAYVVRLKEHIGGLHEDLVEFA